MLDQKCLWVSQHVLIWFCTCMQLKLLKLLKYAVLNTECLCEESLALSILYIHLGPQTTRGSDREMTVHHQTWHYRTEKKKVLQLRKVFPEILVKKFLLVKTSLCWILFQIVIGTEPKDEKTSMVGSYLNSDKHFLT